MKRSLFALVLALILVSSFACAPANTTGTTAGTTEAPPNIAESDCLIFASVKETEKDHYSWYYKTVTNAEDIAAIAEAVEAALENAAVKPPLAEGELAKSRKSCFQIRFLKDGSVVGRAMVYDDGITYGAEYLADTTGLVATLTEIYDSIECEEKPFA